MDRFRCVNNLVYVENISLTCDTAHDPDTDSLASNKTRLSSVSVYVSLLCSDHMHAIPGYYDVHN